MALAAIAALAFTAPAGAQSVEKFYKGRAMKLAVGSSAGGGYDTFARLLSRHINRHIPGKPRIVVQNMPGAGGLRVTNWVYNKARKDGSVFSGIQRGVAFEPLFGAYAKKAKFDPFKLTWLGSLNKSVSVMLASAKYSPVKTFQEAYKKTLIVGAVRSDMETFVVAVKNMLNPKFKIVSGYPGSGDVILAMDRGEVQAIAATSWSTARVRFAKQLKAKKYIPLVQYAVEKHAELPDVPLVLDLARNAEDRKVLELIYARQTIGRPYVAPPGIPADRAKALRAAFKATVEDSKFLKEATRSRLEINPMLAGEVEALLKKIAATSPAILERTKRAVREKKFVAKVKLKTIDITVGKVKLRTKRGRTTARLGLKGSGGKKLKGRATGRTKLKIAGAKAKLTDIKKGLACKITWAGAGGTITRMNCK
jgi:tripartite-type tricarboxylate transporter receptor subunit TctC